MPCYNGTDLNPPMKDMLQIHLNAQGRRKFLVQVKSGDSYSQDLGRYVHLERLIDRPGDRYEEKVVDPETNEVIREISEPLSKHKGHGSAKFKTD